MVFITKLQYSQHLWLKNKKKRINFFPPVLLCRLFTALSPCDLFSYFMPKIFILLTMFVVSTHTLSVIVRNCGWMRAFESHPSLSPGGLGQKKQPRIKCVAQTHASWIVTSCVHSLVFVALFFLFLIPNIQVGSRSSFSLGSYSSFL